MDNMTQHQAQGHELDEEELQAANTMDQLIGAIGAIGLVALILWSMLD